jgi:hypothetical protein
MRQASKTLVFLSRLMAIASANFSIRLGKGNRISEKTLYVLGILPNVWKNNALKRFGGHAPSRLRAKNTVAPG